MIKIVNKKVYAGEGVYIGRPSVLGNPFKIGVHGDREQVIEKYRVWLRGEWKKDGKVKQELIRLAKLSKEGDLILICWCYPKACHGDVLKDAIEKITKARF